VKSGDFLGRIASKFKVRISQIKSWNNLNTNSLNIGQRLVIYTRNTTASQETTSSSEKSSSTDSKIYKVKLGDSLWMISKKYPNLSVEDLKSLNQLKDDTIKPGMTLKVSKG
jgi:membrane-bound lytic murein transglycosylase D